MTTNIDFDEMQILRTVKYLSQVNIRGPSLSAEQVSRWLAQFRKGPERTLALLVLRELVYRSGIQLESSFRQALKTCALKLMADAGFVNDVHWLEVIANRAGNLHLYGGPMDASVPGKSGDLIVRSAAQKYGLSRCHPRDITNLERDDRFLLVDDALLTGDQIISYISQHAPFMLKGQCAIVVALAHESGLNTVRATFPDIQVFAGEVLSAGHGLVEAAQRWVDTGLWPYNDCTPLETYLETHARSGPFAPAQAPLGFGSLGLMLAYEHGAPDNALQLIWGRSDTWAPLRER